MHLAAPVSTLKGVGPKMEALFARLSIHTVEELLWHLPRRYEDFSEITKISDLEPGAVTVSGVISNVSGRYVRRGMHITQAQITDESGGAVKLTWFNQPYRSKAIKPDTKYFVSGDFKFSGGALQIMNPSAEQASDFQTNVARIIPIYKETKGLNSHQIRKVIASAQLAIGAINEELPREVVDTHALLPLHEAIWQNHFPSDGESLKRARNRLAFDELFAIMLANQLSRKEHEHTSAKPIKAPDALLKQFVERLPFALTNAQRRAAWKVLQDMAQSSPMNRLVEGDVGSGKTVVAALAIVAAHHAGAQSLMMAPTEILANQHAESLQEMLGSSGVKMSLLTGSVQTSQKKLIKENLASGEIDLVIGTHALIEESVQFNNLGFAIVDEQHRFGVSQRQRLQQKGGAMPHLLAMTATPIPRSLALTVFGELDVSVIDEMPPGRKPVITELVSPNSRKQMYIKVIEQLELGHQVFAVFPLVEESENLAAHDATTALHKLSTGVFKAYRVGLVHGRMKADEKDKIMADFADHEIDILVSTTVIEVGVNIPNAAVMIIESAERFGLAQLHQLRGRVGRSADQAYCYVVPTNSKSSLVRLKQFVDITDGFKLAEIDMEMRGPGEIYGAMQHGALDLRIAKLSDTKLIEEVRNRVKQLVDDGFEVEKHAILNQRVRKLRAMTSLN